MNVPRFGVAMGGARILFILLVVLALPSVVAHAADDDVRPFTESSLPTGWSIRSDIAVHESQLAGFESRLGGRVAALVNQVISINGLEARVNAIRGASSEDARKIEQTMRGLRGADFVGRRERTVYEVAGQNVLVARRVFAALDVHTDEKVQWEVAFRIALVDDLDYTSGNRVFNHFLALERQPENEEAQASIRAETQGWTFGRTLRLAHADPDVTWELDPKPVSTERGTLFTTYTFEAPPRLAGVPYVDVRGRITTQARFAPLKDGASEKEALQRNLLATRFWPAKAVEVRALAGGAPKGSAAETLLGLLAAVNQRVRYAGAVGTRDGVLEVLARGHGRCWDKADVLVTLARAAGLPARQVAGWVPPLGAGHIWAEIHVEGGWLPVDATTSWLGVSSDYLPFFRTEDGVMPVVYLRMPVLRRLD